MATCMDMAQNDTLGIVVACFADVREAGGGVTTARHTARLLSERGYRVTVLSKSDGELSETPQHIDGVPVIFHTATSGIWWRTPLLVRERRLCGVLRRICPRPDVFLAISPFYVNAAARAWPGVPVIYLFPCLLWRCMPHAATGQRRGLRWKLNQWLLARSERHALETANVTIVQCATVVEDVLDFCPGAKGRLRVAPTGVEDLRKQVTHSRRHMRDQQGTAGNAVVFLTVGHLDRNKNISHIVDALAGLGSSGAYLWVVGSGPARDELCERTRELGLEAQVRFLGYRKDMPDLYAAADAYVHAAWYDNFPNVYLEAMVSGLPVIGPRGDFPRVVSALHTIIKDGAHGYLYDLLEPRGLTEVLQQAMKHPKKLRRMGAAGRQRALEHYTWERYADGIDEAMRRCIRQ